MNIALSTLLIVILLLPGIALRISIIKSDSFENPLDTSKTAELLFITIFSLVLHILGFSLLLCVNFDIHLDQLYFLLTGNSEAIRLLEFEKIIAPSLVPFVLYILLLTIIGVTVGKVMKYVILKYYWDLSYPSLFSITNEWDNIFSGRVFIYERMREKKEEMKESYCWLERNIARYYNSSIKKHYDKIGNIQVDLIEIDVRVSSEDGDILYRGVLYDYFLEKGNALDKIYLTLPYKRMANMESGSEFSEVQSDTFVLPKESILNLNFRVVWLEEGGNNNNI